MLLVLTSDFRSDARCIFEVFLWYVILNLHCLRWRSSRFFYSGYLSTSFFYYLHFSSSSISSFSSLRKVLYDRPSGRLALVFELMDANLYELIKGTIYEQLKIYLSIYLSVYLSIHPIYLFYLSICLSIYLSKYLRICVYIYCLS